MSDGVWSEAAPDTLAAEPEPGTDPELEAVWPAVPGYRILGRLGVGGMGVVYKAEQLGLKRIVAIKTVSAAIHGESLKRFRKEAEAVAAVRHPNIVQIYEVGDCDGLPFFSMEYVAGGSLAERLSAEPQPIRWAARLVADLADAVQAAHDAGVIHRDLKPGNILLQDEESAAPTVQNPSASDSPGKSPTESAQPATLDLRSCIPKITDFGVAKQLDQTVGMTISGALIGTPSYMAPEQAEGRTDDIGPPADIHALGVILYRLVTGQLPFKGSSVATTLAMVGTHEPVAPYRLNGRIHRDLETICLKCLRKSPAQRYASAGALAADLRSFLAGEPIKARPVAPLERLWNWCVRHPARAVATLVSLSVLLVFLPGWLWYQASLEKAELAKKHAEDAQRAAEDLAHSKNYFSLVDHTRQRNERRPSGWSWAGLDDLQKAAALPTSVRDVRDLATEATRCLTGVDIRSTAVWADDLPLTMIAFSPDGRQLAVADYRVREGFVPTWFPTTAVPCAIRLFDTATGELRRTLKFPSHYVQKSALAPVPDGARSLSFSARGDALFVGSRSGWVHYWPLDDKAEPRSRTEPQSWQVFVKKPVDWVLSPPGDPNSVIVGSSQAESVARWPLMGAKAAAQVQFKARVDRMALSPCGRQIAADVGGSLQFHDAATLAPAAGRTALPSMWPFAFDATGEMLVGDRDDKLTFLHAATGTIIRRMEDPNTGISHRAADLIRFNRDGSLVLSLGYGDDDRLLLVWETASGRVVARLPLPGKDFADAAFHPVKDELVVANDGTVEIYAIGGLRIQERVANQALPITSFDFLPSGDLACAGTLGAPDGNSLRTATFWDAASGRFQPERSHLLKGPTGLRGAIAAHPNLSEIAWLTTDSGIDLWNYQTREMRHLPLPTPTHAVFDRTGARLWTIVERRGKLAAWHEADLSSAASWHDALRSKQGTGELYSLAAGKTLIALGSRDGMVHLLRQSDPRSHTECAGITSPVRSVAMDAGERWIAAGYQQGTVRVYQADTRRLVAEIEDHSDSVESLDFSPDAALLATGSRDGAVHLYAVHDGGLERLLTLNARPVVQQLRFHPDGHTLGILLQREHAVRLLRLDDLRDRLVARGIDVSAWPIAAAR